MIKKLTLCNKTDESMLKENFHGKKILSYMKAYGMDYDFCRFYKICEDNNYGIIFIMNSTMLISAQNYDGDMSEIIEFIKMNMPFRIEGTQNIIGKIMLSEYQKLNRTMFEFSGEWNANISDSDVNMNPRLDDVYAILKEGFPNLIQHDLWLTDTSKRVREGISKVCTYKECTTASMIYDIDDTVLIGQVATKLSARGSGYAREFLYWIGDKLYKEGKQAVLYALDVRRSFYHEIGFKELFCEYVLERQDVERDNQQKGAL